MTTIGVLALQGDFAEHAQRLAEVGAEPREIRLPAQLEGIDGLIIPGGESTTIARLLDAYGLLTPLRRMASQGRPLWGTCAGASMRAARADHARKPSSWVARLGPLLRGRDRTAVGAHGVGPGRVRPGPSVSH